MIRYLQLALIASLVAGVWWYGYHKYGLGVSDTELRLENEYLAKLAKVEAKNRELVVEMASKEEEYFNELFDMQENADKYISDVRTRTKRLYIRTKERCVSDDEPSAELSVGEGRSELPADIAERLARRRQEADRLVLKYNACVDYVKKNFEHVNAVQDK